MEKILLELQKEPNKYKEYIIPDNKLDEFYELLERLKSLGKIKYYHGGYDKNGWVIYHVYLS